MLFGYSLLPALWLPRKGKTRRLIAKLWLMSVGTDVKRTVDDEPNPRCKSINLLLKIFLNLLLIKISLSLSLSSQTSTAIQPQTHMWGLCLRALCYHVWHNAATTTIIFAKPCSLHSLLPASHDISFHVHRVLFFKPSCLLVSFPFLYSPSFYFPFLSFSFPLFSFPFLSFLSLSFPLKRKQQGDNNICFLLGWEEALES